ncbi:hypothetical protein MHYP_G00360090 [Metynnis hypsauchen]
MPFCGHAGSATTNQVSAPASTSQTEDSTTGRRTPAVSSAEKKRTQNTTCISTCTAHHLDRHTFHSTHRPSRLTQRGLQSRVRLTEPGSSHQTELLHTVISRASPPKPSRGLR